MLPERSIASMMSMPWLTIWRISRPPCGRAAARSTSATARGRSTARTPDARARIPAAGGMAVRLETPSSGFRHTVFRRVSQSVARNGMKRSRYQGSANRILESPRDRAGVPHDRSRLRLLVLVARELREIRPPERRDQLRAAVGGGAVAAPEVAVELWGGEVKRAH